MVWEDRRLREITEADVRQLVESGLEEHLHLEYKSALYAGTRDGNKEFLLDICQFANAEGGIVLIGVGEKRDTQGQPTGSPDPDLPLGVDHPNPEKVLQSYDSRVVSCIEDRLALESAPIPVTDSKYVIAIRVPSSLNKPHCVRHEGHIYFPSRRERHRYDMDVREIKEMVMRTASRIERAEEELRKVLRAMPDQDDCVYLLIGVIPVFWQDFSLNVRDQYVVHAVGMFDLQEKPNHLSPRYSYKGLERKVSYDISRVYVYRNGLIALNRRLDRGGEPGGAKNVYPSAVDLDLRYFTLRARDVYNAAGIRGPYLITMTLRCRNALRGKYPESFVSDEVVLLPPGEYPLPVMQAESLIEIDNTIRPLCDQVHQAFGQAASPSFNQDGVWLGR
jgi:hypothetical protein